MDYPSEHLLNSIEEIATIKQTLSLRDRSLTSGNGLYVQSGKLPGGAIQYMAGGRFIAKLIFVRNLDGSKDIRKYQPGDWETKVDIILQLCRELKRMYEDVSNWTPEKTAAYEAEEGCRPGRLGLAIGCAFRSLRTQSSIRQRRSAHRGPSDSGRVGSG